MRFTIYEGDVLQIRFISRKGISGTSYAKVEADRFVFLHSENIDTQLLESQ